MDENVPKKYACPYCGGTNLDLQAFAWWDEEKQDWAFDLDDGAEDYCPDCNRSGCGQFTPITDLKTAALGAINNQAKSSEDQHDNSAIC